VSCLSERRCRAGEGVRLPLVSIGLEEPEDVAVGVFYDGGQSSSADILDVLPGSPARGDSLTQARRDVIDVAVADGTGHVMVVAIRVKADLLVTDPEADVVGLVGVWLHAQDGPVERLRCGQVPDGDDDGLAP
jgi:hypothetical protein